MANPAITFPHQRMVKVHREKAKSDFLGIKNENWQAASRDLGAHALQLYLYLASNADNYTLALSPAAIRQAIGMARSTYHDQFDKLVLKRYLVPSHGNTYEFFEVPQPATQSQEAMTADGLDFEESPLCDTPMPSHGLNGTDADTEIDNRDTRTDSVINTQIETECKTNIYVPKVKEIVIKRPVATGRDRTAYTPTKKGGVCVLMATYEQNTYEWMKRQGLEDKYGYAGIYCIKIDDSIVYIGKSMDMLRRMAQHYVGIRKGSEKKYRIMAEAKRKGHRVNFDVLYYAKSRSRVDKMVEIGEKEGEYIRQYQPILNTQIPKEEDWHQYGTQTIDAKAVLENLL